MKTIVFLSFLLTFTTFIQIFSQKINFIQIKTIEYHPEYAEWDDWPEWVSLTDDNKFSMYISEEVIGKVYRVIIYQNGKELSNMAVRYDANKSLELREAWGDPYVNCYYDENNDYIYAQKVSLEQLAKDSSPWKNEDSIMYFWIFSQNTGIAFR